uniref:Ubiquitin carboxyl-terminal hydrolase n=1 Tax=Solanum tuberosum TaxID=4113 RepID=M1DF74_SOLTU
MGKVIAENLISPDHPTLKSDDIENKNINFSLVKIEVEEEEQKEKDLGLVYGSPGRIESAPTMLTSVDSDSIGYIISSDSSGYSYSDGDEWSPLKGEPSSSIVPICSTEPENFKKIVEKETKLIEYKPVKITGTFGKQLLIDHAPTVATLHLKRFKNNGLVAQKVGKHVLFPLELDMLLYTNDINNEEMKYDLYAVIVHSGPSISSGHYYTFIRCAPNEWYKFDDEKVDYVQEDLVLAEEAYIMFYAKRGTPWFFDYSQTHRPFVCFVTPTTSNDTSDGTSLKPKLNKIEDNDSHDQVYCEDQLQDVEIKKNEELMDTLNCDSHGCSLNEKKRKLED